MPSPWRWVGASVRCLACDWLCTAAGRVGTGRIPVGPWVLPMELVWLLTLVVSLFFLCFIACNSVCYFCNWLDARGFWLRYRHTLFYKFVCATSSRYIHVVCCYLSVPKKIGILCVTSCRIAVICICWIVCATSSRYPCCFLLYRPNKKWASHQPRAWS